MIGSATDIATLTARAEAAERERDELRERVAALRDWHPAALEWRGVDPGRQCQECGGAGTTLYGTTGTWRSGAGGATPTLAVCDKCWGSGDKTRVWPSHRLAEEAPHHKARAEAAEAKLAKAVEALRPFANDPATRLISTKVRAIPVCEEDVQELRSDDFRRARATLAELADTGEM